MSSELKNIVEALMLVSDTPLSIARIQGLFDGDSAPEAGDIQQAIDELEQDYSGRGVQVRRIGKGYRFQTQARYSPWISKMHAGRPPRLSRAQLETLAIIAYRQPVTRGDIEEIRGVSVSPEIMQRLLEREWIRQVGVRDVPGRPALFGTTPEFLAYFNLESLKDLPPLAERRELGEIARELEASPAGDEAPDTQQDMFDADADAHTGGDAGAESGAESDVDVEAAPDDAHADDHAPGDGIDDFDFKEFDQHMENIMSRDAEQVDPDPAAEETDHVENTG